ncbi:hypothetical protein JCM10207_003042 [Rhodosporidiobolus poonsookiae]
MANEGAGKGGDDGGKPYAKLTGDEARAFQQHCLQVYVEEGVEGGVNGLKKLRTVLDQLWNDKLLNDPDCKMAFLHEVICWRGWADHRDPGYLQTHIDRQGHTTQRARQVDGPVSTLWSLDVLGRFKKDWRTVNPEIRKLDAKTLGFHDIIDLSEENLDDSPSAWRRKLVLSVDDSGDEADADDDEDDIQILPAGSPSRPQADSASPRPRTASPRPEPFPDFPMQELDEGDFGGGSDGDDLGGFDDDPQPDFEDMAPNAINTSGALGLERGAGEEQRRDPTPPVPHTGARSDDEQDAEVEPIRGCAASRKTEQTKQQQQRKTPPKPPPLPIKRRQRKVSPKPLPKPQFARMRKRGGSSRSKFEHRIQARSTYKRKEKAKVVNAFAEERLAQYFPPLSDKQRLHRRTFRLDDFAVLEASHNPAERVSIPLHHLVDDSYEYRLVIVGLATPEEYYEDEDEWEEGDSEDAQSQPLEVHLFGNEIRQLTFTATGPVLETRLARYRLVQPHEKRRQTGSWLDLAPDYREHVEDFRRLLNVFAFARYNAFRGGYKGTAREVAHTGEEISKALRSVRSLEWQRSIPSLWRVDLDDLDLQPGSETQLLFDALPDIPWIPPAVYKLCVRHFPIGAFRTDNSSAVMRDLEEEERAEIALLDKYERRTLEDDLAAENNEAVSLVDAVGWRAHPSSAQLPRSELSAFDEIDVFYQARRGTERFSDDEDSLDALLDANDFDSDDEIVDEDGEAAEKGEQGNDTDDSAGEPKKGDAEQDDDHSSRLWFSQVEYFYRDDDGMVMAHVSWLCGSKSIPSLSKCITSRVLFKLDQCDDQPLSTVIGKIDEGDFRFLTNGEPCPRFGFFCSSLYSVDDGSFTDRSILTPNSTPRCGQRDLDPCASCETTIAHYSRTKESSEGRVLTPIPSVESGVLFLLNDTPYHVNDHILVRPHTETGRRFGRPEPFRLARLLRLADPIDFANDPLQHVEVEWIIRATEAGAHSVNKFEAEREVLPTAQVATIETTRLDGHFTLRHLDLRGQSTEEQRDEINRVERSGVDVFWLTRQFRPSAVLKIVNAVDGCFSFKKEDVELVTAETLAAASCAACRAAHAETTERLGKIQDKLDDFNNWGIRLDNLATYAGGGLLDFGMGEGCAVLRTNRAVEKHGPAASFMRSNALEGCDVDVRTVSDHIEDAYHDLEGSRARPQHITGGAPCQGFSSVNRYKKEDDLRCAEPLVYLGSLAVNRPSFALFENVRGFRQHALPTKDSKRGSFFQLFLAVALMLRYQLRWQVDNAACYGTPQDRRRLIVQLAVSGVPLPSAPRLTHAALAREQFNHHLREGDSRPWKRDPTLDYALHPASTFHDATSDLSSFGFTECFNLDSSYKKRTIGPEWSPGNPAPYRRPAESSLQLRYRTQRAYSADDKGYTYFATRGVTHHLCRSVTEDVARRLCNIGVEGVSGKSGNHLDFQGEPFYIELPRWLKNKSKARQSLWWARLKKNERLSTLRTQLSIDGASHGPRIHPSDNRFISVREMMRVQGLPDFVEVIFDSNIDDESCEEAHRILGNGVPVQLGEAYGRALFDTLVPFLLAHIDSSAKGRVFDLLSEQVGAPGMREVASPAAAEAYAKRKEELAEPDSDEVDEEEEAEVGPAPRPRPPLRTSSSAVSASPLAAALAAESASPRSSTRPTSLEATAPPRRTGVAMEVDLDDSDSDVVIEDEAPAGRYSRAEKGKGRAGEQRAAPRAGHPFPSSPSGSGTTADASGSAGKAPDVITLIDSSDEDME